jgi:hypothetical protein
MGFPLLPDSQDLAGSDPLSMDLCVDSEKADKMKHENRSNAELCPGIKIRLVWVAVTGRLMKETWKAVP